MSTSTATPKKPPLNGTPTSKKTPASTNSPATAANSTNLNRSPSRMAADSNPSTRGTTTTGAINRARSVRNGASNPVSARAAARKPAAVDSAAEDDAKAELQAKLDELQEKLREAERVCEDSQKQAAVLQVRLDEAVKEQGMLEEHVHENTERIEELENEKKDNLRARRELEQIYEAERAQMMKEKEDAQTKEDEMQNAMQRLRETLSQKEMRDRTSGLEDDRRPSMSRTGSLRSGNASPNPEAGQFAPPSSLQRSDSRSSSRLVMQKDKIIEGLRLELAEAQIKLVELENQGGGRVHELQKEIYDIKMQNARLMEENESFQLLLSEKTLNGDFTHSSLLRVPSGADSRPPSSEAAQGTSLADELEGHNEESDLPEDMDPSERRHQIEVNKLKDQNKALTLYINNIISRLLQHEQFEEILDKTPDLMSGPGAASRRYASTGDIEKDLPPPPPPKDDSQNLGVSHSDDGAAGGFLQRARSVMGGRPKPRPTSISQTLTPADIAEPRVTENPVTAPSIPLARSSSTRGHRRANSEWPAASVTNMMYRGPSPGLQGPTSPGLTSPSLTGRNSFFGAGAAGSRLPSTSSMASSSTGTIPAISEQQGKENVPMTNHRQSVTSNPSSSTPDIEPLDPTSIGAVSPPRSTTSSSGDRERGETRSGAIMMGSKPRPLRLVQEAADDDKARKSANRGSWFGWMNKGGSAPTGTGGA